MWFAIAMLFMALLSSLDIGIYSYIGYKTNVTPFQYGLISAMWSAVFIISNLFLGKVSDKGNNKFLIVISFLSIMVTGVLFSFHNLTFLAIAYMFHALGVASSNLAISTTIFEIKSSDKWKYYIELQKFSFYLIRGLGLLSFYFIYDVIPFDYIIYFSVAVGLITFLSLPKVSLKVERILHSFSQDFNSITDHIKMLSYLAYDSINSLPNAVKQGFISYKRVSTKMISLSMFFATFTGDYIFTILPLLIKSDISLSLLWLSYGITAIIISLSLILFSMFSNTNNKKVALFSIIARGIWLVSILSFVNNTLNLIAYIAISSVLFSVIDIALYNIFSENSSGYGSHIYYTLRELGTLTGSLLVGIAFTLGKEVFITIPIISTIISALMLLIA
ncbi:MAG: MFS transporter [Caldisphaera sp.]|uniref:MFS transporter n=1 Tax=Caldisphaera sp. TaxID=2060322 RepID=UPI003D0D32C5